MTGAILQLVLAFWGPKRLRQRAALEPECGLSKTVLGLIDHLKYSEIYSNTAFVSCDRELVKSMVPSRLFERSTQKRALRRLRRSGWLC